MQSLKDQVQELHRDLTKHHSLIKAEIMGDILHKSLQVDAAIASEYASVEGMRAAFQEVAPPQALTPLSPPVACTWATSRQEAGERGLWPVPHEALVWRALELWVFAAWNQASRLWLGHVALSS